MAQLGYCCFILRTVFSDGLSLNPMSRSTALNPFSANTRIASDKLRTPSAWKNGRSFLRIVNRYASSSSTTKILVIPTPLFSGYGFEDIIQPVALFLIGELPYLQQVDATFQRFELRFHAFVSKASFDPIPQREQDKQAPTNRDDYGNDDIVVHFPRLGDFC